jgi:hypothetical protein
VFPLQSSQIIKLYDVSDYLLFEANPSDFPQLWSDVQLFDRENSQYRLTCFFIVVGFLLSPLDPYLFNTTNH